MTRFVIVGGGLAGAKAAETLRDEGFDGEVVLFGDETERPYERPAMAKGYLLGKDERDSVFVHSADWYDEAQGRASCGWENPRHLDRPRRPLGRVRRRHARLRQAGAHHRRLGQEDPDPWRRPGQRALPADAGGVGGAAGGVLARGEGRDHRVEAGSGSRPPPRPGRPEAPSPSSSRSPPPSTARSAPRSARSSRSCTARTAWCSASAESSTRVPPGRGLRSAARRGKASAQGLAGQSGWSPIPALRSRRTSLRSGSARPPTTASPGRRALRWITAC